jgi:hypothetical protein
LSLPVRFNIDFAGILCVRPIGEVQFPHCTWEDSTQKHHEEFENLSDAVVLFSKEKRNGIWSRFRKAEMKGNK